MHGGGGVCRAHTLSAFVSQDV
eukprot:COSAG02_NODE_43228_length_377_cov_0.406475_1_plen_21_part_10